MKDIFQQEYGVPANLTVIDVREKIIECFTDAHKEYTEIPFQDRKQAEVYCRELIRKAFMDTVGDFDSPDKASLMRVLDELAKFAENFRNQEIIKEHYQSMVALVDRLDDSKKTI